MVRPISGQPLRGSRLPQEGPDAAVRFSDETSLDQRTTDRMKVVVYATIPREASIAWYHSLLTHRGVATEWKSSHLLAVFEGLPSVLQERVWRGVRAATIQVVDVRPHLADIDKKLLQRMRELAGQGDATMKHLLRLMEILIVKRMLVSSLPVQLELRIHPARPVISAAHGVSGADVNFLSDLLAEKSRKLPTPREALEFVAKGNAAFAPALFATERITPPPGRFWLGPTPDDFERSGTVKALRDVHLFDEGNARHLRWLEQDRRSFMNRLDWTGREALHRLSGDRTAFLEIDSKLSPWVQAADIVAGLVREVLQREGPVGVVRRGLRVQYNGKRLTENSLERVLRLWSAPA